MILKNYRVDLDIENGKIYLDTSFNSDWTVLRAQSKGKLFACERNYYSFSYRFIGYRMIINERLRKLFINLNSQVLS